MAIRGNLFSSLRQCWDNFFFFFLLITLDHVLVISLPKRLYKSVSFPVLMFVNGLYKDNYIVILCMKVSHAKKSSLFYRVSDVLLFFLFLSLVIFPRLSLYGKLMLDQSESMLLC